MYSYYSYTENRSSKKVPKGEERINVDLDKEANKPDSGRGKFTLVIKFTKIVRLDFLAAYLRRQSSWDNTVLECMSRLISRSYQPLLLTRC